MIKARDVIPTLKQQGYERGSATILQGIIEQQQADREAIAQLAEMMTSMSDTLMQIAGVATVQRSMLEQVQKTMGIDDGLDTGVQTKDG